MRGAVTAEAIRDESPGYAATALQQPTEKSRGGMAISTWLQQDIDDLAILVDGPPEVLAPADDGNEQLVQMPRVAAEAGAPPEASSVGGAERLAPVPDGLVRHRDAALGQEILDVTEAEGEAVVEPDGVADDGGRESVSGIAHDGHGHPATVPGVASS